MTSVVHTPDSAVRPGAPALRGTPLAGGGTRTAASLLLAAGVSALMVVASQMVEAWSDGHLLAAWMVLWLVAFASLALLAGPARRTVLAWRRARDDERTWNAALHDARLMADLSRAMNGIAVDDPRRYRF